MAVRHIVFFLLFSFMALTLFGAVYAVADEPEARFILGRDNIASWRQSDDSIQVRLTEETRNEFLTLTLQNIGKTVSVYIGEELVMSPVVRAPIDSGSLQISPASKAILTQLKICCAMAEDISSF